MVLLRSLLPILTLGLALSACGDEKPMAEPAAEVEKREVEIPPEVVADPTLRRDAKVSPDLRDPFKKDEGEGRESEPKIPSARPAQDDAAEPAEGSKKPSPDLEDPFKK